MKKVMLFGLVAALHATRAEAAEAKAGATAAKAAAPAAGKPAAAALVDLNRATEDELVALPGIGPSKARAIVEHRKKAPFRKAEDLLKVKGVGRGIFKQVRDLVTVRETASPTATPAPRSAAPTPSLSAGKATR